MHQQIPSPLNHASNLFVGLFSVLLLLVGKGYIYGSIPLLLLSLPLLITVNKSYFSREVVEISVVFLLYFALNVISIMVYGGKWREVDLSSRGIFLIPLLLFLLRHPPKTTWLFTSVAVGSIIAGVIALYHVHVLGHSRAFHEAGKGYQAIQSGGMSMSLAIFTCVGLFYSLEKKSSLKAFLFLIAMTFGFIGSFLSGSRGTWILAPLVIGYLLFTNRGLITKRVMCIIIVYLGILSSISYSIIAPRITDANNDLASHLAVATNNKDTSVGARLEMWKSAYLTTINNPFFGAGFDGRNASKAEQVSQGIANEVILKYNRAHNQYLEEASTKGILGLFSLLLLFILPAIYFYKPVKGSPENRFVAQCGLCHVLLVSSYCLSQNFLSHSSGFIFYGMYLIIFFAIIYSPQNTHPAQSA